MPARKKCELLPEDVRRELDGKLVKGYFSDYDGLTQWLNAAGFEISKAAVQRYGSKLEKLFAAAAKDTYIIAELVRSAGDLSEAGSEIAAGAAAILQTDIISTVLELREEEDTEKRANLLSKLTRAQADIGRMTIANEKHRAEVRKAVEAAAAKVDAIVKKCGLSDETAAEIRSNVLGVAA